MLHGPKITRGSTSSNGTFSQAYGSILTVILHSNGRAVLLEGLHCPRTSASSVRPQPMATQLTASDSRQTAPSSRCLVIPTTNHAPSARCVSTLRGPGQSYPTVGTASRRHTASPDSDWQRPAEATGAEMDDIVTMEYSFILFSRILQHILIFTRCCCS